MQAPVAGQRGRRALAALAIALSVTACALLPRTPMTRSEPPTDRPRSPDAFVPVGRPVLDHRIEHDAARETYRLSFAGTEVLCEGSLEACQGALVASLAERHGHGHANLPIFTLGGKQFWGDVFWFAGWRIQENSLTGHHRLLDPDDVRRAWGDYGACRAAFEAQRRAQELVLEREHLVVLLHGLGRSAGSLARMARALEEADYGVAAITYPSTRRSIEEHASQLETLLDRLEGATTLSFVTHSLGGLVVRSLLARKSSWMKRLRVHRLAMLAPPSRGSALAQELADFLPFQWILGPSGRDVTLDEAARVPPPTCRFGIVAAERRDGEGWNPLLEGADDGVVRVEETRLEGAEDFLLVQGLHTFLMDDPEVVASVVRYLASGRFAPR